MNNKVLKIIGGVLAGISIFYTLGSAAIEGKRYLGYRNLPPPRQASCR